MAGILISISKYLLVILMAVYTYSCFSVFRRKNEEDQKDIYARQNAIMFFLHFLCYAIIIIHTNNTEIILFYLYQVVFLVSTLLLFRVIYPGTSRLITNNMCLLISIGFIMISRLTYEKSQKQFMIAAVSMVIALIIPVFIRRLKCYKKLTYVYAVLGIGGLLAVAVLGRTSYGAKLAFRVGGISIQPSEFIKIIFVFYVASMLHRDRSLRQIIKTTVVAAVHVLILVGSKDLGSALIFFVIYLSMLYAATKNPIYIGAGAISGSVAALAAYAIFRHVRTRVIAWKDPLSVAQDEGYQIVQSLFAIGTGGWFGMGLYQGSPLKIPVVEEDFIFSAICEEFGVLFGLCLILICVSCFVMFFNIAMSLRDSFYKLIALGLGCGYGFQVFLTIGGVTKFIPLTGVTLPMVSYGGSSLLSTLISFSVIQGLYMIRNDEEERRENRKPGNSGKKRKRRKPDAEQMGAGTGKAGTGRAEGGQGQTAAGQPGTWSGQTAAGQPGTWSGQTAAGQPRPRSGQTAAGQYRTRQEESDAAARPYQAVSRNPGIWKMGAASGGNRKGSGGKTGRS